MKHLIRFAAVMAAAAFLALPLSAQSHGGHASYNNNHSRSGSSSSHVDSRRGSSPSGSAASARPSGGSSSGRSSNIGQRPSGGSSSANRPSNGGSGVNRPSGHNDKADRPSNGGQHPSGGSSANRPYGHNDRADRPFGGHRPSGSGMDRPSGEHRPSGSHRPAPGSRPYADGHRPAPRDMGHVHVNHRPGHNPPRPGHRELRGAPVRFSHHGPHRYGYYVSVLPPHFIHRVYHGIDYYYWDDVWYRYRAGRYWVCRPPFGYVFTPLADAVLTAIVLNSLTEENNTVQEAEAKSLNLIRSYAAAGTEYFYNDGVFYIKGDDGQYVVIVPPAGAMVDYLPEDFEEFEFEGNTYYKVDDTVYRMAVTEDGKACFEVLGQLAE